jgi:uncharacterized protein YlxW (UPF0749 family)
MTRIGRTKFFAAGAAAALFCAGMAVIAQTATPSDAKSAQDKEKVEKELKDLQEQRAKLDARIRELRKQSGLTVSKSLTFTDPTARCRY